MTATPDQWRRALCWKPAKPALDKDAFGAPLGATLSQGMSQPMGKHGLKSGGFPKPAKAPGRKQIDSEVAASRAANGGKGMFA